MAGREKMISSLLWGRKISQPQNQCSNLLLAGAVNQILQTCQCRVLSMECTVFKCRGFCGHIVYDPVQSNNDKVDEANENGNADEKA